MKTYWSCSKFADFIRGIDKPSAETNEGWKLWRKQCKLINPIRWWLAEVLLDKIENIVTYPSELIHNIRYYLRNRFIIKTHSLTATKEHIERGKWCDLDNRILYCLFDTLVDFIEVERAWRNTGKHKRDKVAGLNSLAWGMSLINDEEWGYTPDHPDYGKPMIQSVEDKEIYELYNWWVNIYPNRPDPYDISGWSDLCKNWNIFDDESESDEPSREARDISLKKLHEIEEAYEKEDEEMLIRLIKIRYKLWT